jgi:hypothetical protein
MEGVAIVGKIVNLARITSACLDLNTSSAFLENSSLLLAVNTVPSRIRSSSRRTIAVVAIGTFTYPPSSDPYRILLFLVLQLSLTPTFSAHSSSL